MRTNPTIKPLTTSNMKQLRSFEVSMGFWQFITFSIVIVGALSVAFYLGFFSGQKVGLETALASTVNSSLKLPFEDHPQGAQDDIDRSNEVYAKLGQLKAPLESRPTPKLSKEPMEGLSADNFEDFPLEPKASLGQKELSDKAKKGNEPKAIQRNNEKAVGKEELAEEDVDTIVRVLGEKNFAANPGKENVNHDREERLSPQIESLGALRQKSETKTQATESARISAEVATSNRLATSLKGGTVGSLDKSKVDGSIKKLGTQEANRNVAVAGSEQSIASSIAKGNSNPAETEKAKSVPQPVPQSASLVGAQSGGSLYSSPSPGWYAQVAAPRKREDAEKIAKQLKGSKFQVIIENAQVRGQEYFRVLVGPETNRELADKSLDSLKRQSYLQADPFVRLVK